MRGQRARHRAEDRRSGRHRLQQGTRPGRRDGGAADLPGDVIGVRADSRSADDLDRLHTQVERRSGRLDVLVVNAAAIASAALGTITEDVIRSVFDLNIAGTIMTVQKALPLLADGGVVPHRLDGRTQGVARAESTGLQGRGPRPRPYPGRYRGRGRRCHRLRRPGRGLPRQRRRLAGRRRLRPGLTPSRGLHGLRSTWTPPKAARVC